MPIHTGAFGDAPTAEGQTAEDDKPKPKRRTRAQLIADAVVPAADEQVDLKDSNTGQKYRRPWLVAVEMVRDGKAEFVKKDLKYAVMKMDEQRGAQAPSPAQPHTPTQPLALSQDEADGLERRWAGIQEQLDETSARDLDAIKALSAEAEHVRQKLIKAGYQDVASDDAYERRGLGDPIPYSAPDLGQHSGKRVESATDASGQPLAPPEAEVGDEVRIGADTYYVGHGGVLVQGVVGTPDGTPIRPKRSWQRELGTGGKGPWEAKLVNSDGGQPQPNAFAVAQPEAEKRSPEVVTMVTDNVEYLGLGVWKVGAGYLEKIGLPEYSSLQIGPVTTSMQVLVEDATDVVSIRREDGSVVSAPRAVVDGLRACFQACEISMRFERGQMLDFLEAARPGSTKPQ